MTYQNVIKYVSTRTNKDEILTGNWFMEKTINRYKNFYRTLLEKYSEETIFKIGRKENMIWIHLAQDTDEFRALLNTIMNLP